jgi:serine/threonine protein kinase
MAQWRLCIKMLFELVQMTVVMETTNLPWPHSLDQLFLLLGANILLNDKGQAKLGDFGLLKAVSLNTIGTTNLSLAPNDAAGTHYHQAPEVLEDGTAYGRKADVW